MLSKIRKGLIGEKGFTLVELMTVLVILGIILGIGAPKYLRIQSQAEWDADAAMIKSFAKAAEMYVIKNDVILTTENNSITLDDLITNKVIDGTIVLNRTNSNDAANTSVKNTGTSISAYGTEAFIFDPDIGNVTNLDGDQGVIVKLIGRPVYE
ncbi:MAG: type II secretion system protein [Peptococcia bacterium]|jgi:prepilin-type N-terminal cleavage/methylation domain-containing protein